MRENVLIFLGALYLVMSFVSFCMYAIDKRRANKNKRRVPEATLLLIDLLFGWPGGFIGQRVWHHKTAKLSYQARYWAAVIVHVGAWGAAGWMMFMKGE